jgi:hypothetical protein
VIGNQAYDKLPEKNSKGNAFRYLLKVYVDNFVNLIISTSHEQLRHVSTGTMMGIHDVFPANEIDANDPISKKKIKQLDGNTRSPKPFWVST